MNRQSKQTPVEGASTSSTVSSGDSIEPDNTSSPDNSQSPQAEANMRGLGSMNMKLLGYIPVESGLSRMLAPRPLVICGPSGTGKSTLLKKLMSEFSDYFGFSVSHTTRKPRQGEEDGREYHFTDIPSMLTAIDNGEFIEYTQFSGNYYGTSKKSVQDVQNKGRICILDVEIEGVKNLKKTDLNPRFVFVKPPSIEALEVRLRSRGTETEESLMKRLTQAKQELAYGEVPGNFDVVLVNDDVEEAYLNLRNFILRDVEELKKSRGM